MLRDIAKHKAQFISIFLMAFLGVFVFAGVGGWVYYLFLINFIVFIFILCFLEAILGLGFLFSILFCCDYIIAWGMKNCFGFEKLL